MFRCTDHTVVSVFNTPGISSVAGMLGADKMWPRFRGKGIVVAIVDTGVDVSHPALAKNIIGGYNAISGTSFNDDNGHGTHVAGIVTQVAPEVSLLVIKVLDAKGAGSMDAVVNGLKWAASWRGPKGEWVNIVNMSLGSPQSNIPMWDLLRAMANSRKTIFAAAGNEGDGNIATPELSYPAVYPETISIGAVDFASRATRFTNSDKSVDMAAPGDNIQSTWPDGRYAVLSGTSMACPAAAGLAALYMEKYRMRFGEDPTPAELRVVMKAYTKDIDSVGIDANTGAGLIQAWL